MNIELIDKTPAQLVNETWLVIALPARVGRRHNQESRARRRPFRFSHRAVGYSRSAESLYISAVICSETSPIMKIVTEALNRNTVMLDRRCWVTNVNT